MCYGWNVESSVEELVAGMPMPEIRLTDAPAVTLLTDDWRWWMFRSDDGRDVPIGTFLFDGDGEPGETLTGFADRVRAAGGKICKGMAA